MSRNHDWLGVTINITPESLMTTAHSALDAKPHLFPLNPAKSAVLVVDMQNDFGAEGGMFARAGIDVSMIRKAVGPTARVLSVARRCGIQVVYPPASQWLSPL